MVRDRNLTLYEEIMLLSIRDEKGTMEHGTNWNLGVGGAVVAELMLSGHVAAVDMKKKVYLEVANHRPPKDKLLAECLERVRTSRRRETIPTWVTRFSNTKHLKKRVAGGLCRKRILKEDEDKVLLLFKRKIYPEVDPVPERELRERMRKALFGLKREVDPRTSIMIALAHSCRILPQLFDKKKLKGQKKRLEAITRGELVGSAAKEAVEAVEAAMLMAAIIPTIVTTTVISSN
jgi:hypothetical protein